ncbi:hypothetical protein TRM7557_03108 [Tritonibacter multivorans]|uniref:Uncharacterized protein n=1 Tax=Tritonibacter multivorans TaxID=928856 RepID=A0A0N7M0M2_9RHOB|nr:hypothetical protein [Tritonibacter multivorans]MDA7422762.1 hypothetical protein [Tritonibacter multivorans]CUH80857.1 hypothetical protein TRM7557_03108 [Tritonibacter multivorans]SFD56711.1 hypothetical protein SAMN04488049_11656 [Tritonibacter multivorans]
MVGLALGLALDGVSGAALGPETPPAPPTPVTTVQSVALTPLTHDRWVYDVGAARGLNAAQLPVSGSAVGEGAVVLARAVRADTGVPVTNYAEIATVAGGVFAGAVTCPKSPHDLRIEVLQADGSTVLSAADRRYVAGHRIAVWGQSWYAGLFGFREEVAFDQTQPGAVYSVANANTLQIIGQKVDATLPTTPDPRRLFVQNDALVNDATVRFANSLNAVAPNDRFCIVVHARGATGLVDLMDDSASAATERDWTLDDAPVHAFAAADGAAVGAVMVDWYHNLTTTHRDNADLLHLFVFSTLADGTPRQTTQAAGSAQSFVGVEDTYAFDRSLADIYDWSEVRLILNGPNRHELATIDYNGQPGGPDTAWTYKSPPQPMSMADVGFAPVPAALGREQVRLAYDLLAQHPAVVTRGLQGNHIFCGGGDEQHPEVTYNGSEDGDAEFERYTSYALLEGLGMVGDVVSADQPRLASATYASTHIEVAFETAAGPVDITTTRLARGEAQDPSRPAHQTQVMGFEVAGLPVAQADVVNGRVHIGPLGGAPTVTLNDFGLQFGRGIGAGQLGHIEDLTLQAWKEFPGWAKPGLPANAEGARIVPASVPARFDQITVNNPLDVAPGVSVRSDVTSAFRSPGTLSAILFGRYSNDQAILPRGTIEFRGAVPDQADTEFGNYLFQLSSSISIRIDTRPTKRQTIASGGGLTLLRSANLSYVPDTLSTFRVSWDAVAGRCWLDVEGVRISEAYSGAGEEMNDLAVMNFAARAGLQMAWFKMWDAATGDGGAPTDVPFLTVSGGPGYTNLHPWRVGGAFT